MTSRNRAHYVDAGIMRIKKNSLSCFSPTMCLALQTPILFARFTDFGFSEKLLNVRNSFNG